MTPEHTNQRDGSWLLRTAITGVLSLAVGAFVLSYSALHAVAIAAGINPSLAGLYPLIIDGFLTIASLAVLSLRHQGPRVTWYPWSLLGGFFSISVWCNALHAANRTGDITLTGATAALVSAMPPVALGLAIHLLILMLRPTTSAPPAEAVQWVPLNETAHPVTIEGTERPRRSDQPSGPSADRSDRSAVSNRPLHEQPNEWAATHELRGRAVRAVRQAHDSGVELTGAELGRRLGVSTRHGRRLLQSLNDQEWSGISGTKPASHATSPNRTNPPQHPSSQPPTSAART